MERITGWDKGNGYMVKCFENSGCPDMDTNACSTCEHFIEAWKKLAAYEDTGLMPEEVAEFVHKDLPKALDRLAEYESTGLTPAECHEFAEAKFDGRLVMPALRVNATVWELTIYNYNKNPGVKERFIESIQIYRDNKSYFNTGRTTGFSESDIGETVFMTREEAEAALITRKSNKEAAR